MMKGKHGRMDITPETRFRVKYMGSTRTLEPGTGAIHRAVERIKREAKLPGRSSPKVALEVYSDGIRFKELKKDKGQRFIPLDRISFGAPANNAASPVTNVFAFNHHISKSPLVVECHAVLCDSSDTVRALGLALYSAFREGYFRSLRLERKKSSDLRESLIFDKSHAGDSHGGVVGIQEVVSENTPQMTNSECVLKKKKTADREVGMPAMEIGHDEKELDNIIRDLLSTVEREAAKLEQASLE